MKIIRSAYGPKQKVTLSFTPGTGRTKQSFKAESDINNIMARFQKTGVLEFAARHAPRYGDVRGVDFAAAMRVVAEANEMFAALPARLRDRFNNNPGKFLAFVQDDANRDEAEKLGLVKKKEAAPPPINPAPAPQGAPSAAGGQGAPPPSPAR